MALLYSGQLVLQRSFGSGLRFFWCTRATNAFRVMVCTPDRNMLVHFNSSGFFLWTVLLEAVLFSRPFTNDLFSAFHSFSLVPVLIRTCGISFCLPLGLNGFSMSICHSTTLNSFSPLVLDFLSQYGWRALKSPQKRVWSSAFCMKSIHCFPVGLFLGGLYTAQMLMPFLAFARFVLIFMASTPVGLFWIWSCSRFLPPSCSDHVARDGDRSVVVVQFLKERWCDGSAFLLGFEVHLCLHGRSGCSRWDFSFSLLGRIIHWQDGNGVCRPTRPWWVFQLRLPSAL